MSPLGWSFIAVGMALQCLVLAALLRGSWRRYPIAFVYMIATTLSTVVQVAFLWYFGQRSRQFAMAYWIADLICSSLVMLLIAHLIGRAMGGERRRDLIYWGLMAVMAAVAIASTLYLRANSQRLSWNRWMTEVARDYYFVAMLLNAWLWMTLVRLGRRDRQLYLVTSGMGLMLSGAAVAHSVRLASHFWGIANAFLIATYLGGLLVWRFAFQTLPAVEPAAEVEPTPHALAQPRSS